MRRPARVSVADILASEACARRRRRKILLAVILVLALCWLIFRLFRR